MEHPRRFGQFEVLADRRQVLVDGQPATLGARAFDLLQVLMAHRDRVLSKDELLALVWPGMVVEENNLTVQISALRKLLGADVIVTVAGRGYRFIANSVPAQPSQASKPANAAVKPAVTTPSVSPGLVPAALNKLIGRASAVQEILNCLKTTRCLSLTGAGGSGKTRLAQELAWQLRAQYGAPGNAGAGGVCWVELAGLSDPKMLLPTIAHALGVSDASQPALQSVLERLHEKRALLVLDNCEHLIDDCAKLAVQLLRALPMLQVLATSREALRIAGEVNWVVPPLDVPSAADVAAPVTNLTRLASVQLLVERICQSNTHFTVTPANAPSLAKICRSLEGLPLALELVAAQVGMRTLDQIATQLESSLGLLTIGQRGAMLHHQTMSAAVQWGYDLLQPAEQALFMRLSVFVGGWTLDGAVAIAQGPDLAAAQVPGLLARLVRSSMVLAKEADGAVRFRMLEPVRQFAYATLENAGQADSARQQLLGWCVHLCDTLAPELSGPKQVAGYKTLGTEIDNFRAVLAWSKVANLEQGLHLAANLWRFWQAKGFAKELLTWFEETLPLAHTTSIAVQGNAYNSAGIMARTCALYDEAARLHSVSLVMRRGEGDRRGVAIALNNLAVVARDQSDHNRVEHFCRESLAIAREIGDKNLQGLGLMQLGTALRGQDRAAAAEEAFRESFTIFSELGDLRVLANLQSYLGELAQARGDWPSAQQCFNASLELNETLENAWGLALSTCNLASLLVDMQNYAGALSRVMQSFGHYQSAGATHGLELCFEVLAKIAQQRGLYWRAAWCWGVLEQIEKKTGTVTTAALQTLRSGQLQRLAALMAGLMTREAFEEARSSGQRETLEQTIHSVLEDPDLAQATAKPALFLVSASRA